MRVYEFCWSNSCALDIVAETEEKAKEIWYKLKDKATMQFDELEINDLGEEDESEEV